MRDYPVRKIILFFVLALFNSLLFAGSADKLARNEAARENQPLYLTSELSVAPKAEQEESKLQKYFIEITYPQLQGENLSPNAMLFNKAIMDLAYQETERFKKYVAADAPHMKTLPEEIQKNSFNLDYDIDVIQRAEKDFIISVRLTVEGYQAGRPHPYHNHRVLNFDLTAGKAIELNELFKKNSKYLNFIANYCNKKLNEKLDDKSFIAEGTKPLATNYKNWNLENDDILITFEEYQVAPYSHGPQEINIPFSELKVMMAQTSPVYALLDKKVGEPEIQVS